jgi:hypothetical protein
MRKLNVRRAGIAAAVAGIAALGCVESEPARAPVDSVNVPRTAPVVTSTRVNQGTYGMASRVKWLFSPESAAIIAMVDPVGVENEALPNGFFFGNETRNFQARMDSVWDVAPSPDWNVIAFSRAYVMNPREQDSIPPAMLQDVARRTGLDTATVRSSSFASSGMSMARAIAHPGTITIPADMRATGAQDAAAPKMYPIALGWRVRWTQDGLVALGSSPARVQDDEPSQSWGSLDPKTGAFHGTLPSSSRVIEPKWVVGPTLDISIPVDMQSAPAISVSSGGRTFSIESERGVISARETTAGLSTPRSYTIGSGKALAATKGGRYILALAPRAKVEAYEVPVEAVVYVVGW